MREAGEKFTALVTQAEQQGRGREDLESQEADRLIARMADEKYLPKAGEYQAAEMGELVEVCAIPLKAGAMLGMFDARKHLDPKATPQVIASQFAALMQKNEESFSRQLRILLPFGIRCAAKEIAPLSQFLLTLPPAELTDIRRQGAAQMRMGLANMFAGAIRSLGNPKQDEAFRLALLQALAESAPSLIPALPVPLRREIRTLSNQTGEATSARYAAYLGAINQALDDQTCEGLCTF